MHMVRNGSGSTHPGRCPYEYATDAECWIPAFEGISIPSPPTRVYKGCPHQRNSRRSAEGGMLGSAGIEW